MRTVDIKGLEKYYTISDSGIVMSKDRLHPSSKTIVVKGKEMAQCKFGKGKYPAVGLSAKEIGFRKVLFVHRLVAEHFVHNPNPSEYLQCNHIDGNHNNPHYTNLEWVNQSMNMKHSIYVLGNKLFGGKGYAGIKGKDNPNSKIIVRIYPNGEMKEYFGIGQAARDVIENKETISVRYERIRDNIRETLRGNKKHFIGCKWSMKE